MFTAVVPPRTVTTDLARFFSPLQEETEFLRWASPDQLHISCSFMAQVPTETVPRLIDRLAMVAVHTPPFELSIRGGGTFPAGKLANVLWMGVADRDGGLPTLAFGCRWAGLATDLTVDLRPFKAHLTLARTRRGTADLADLVERLSDYQGPAWLVRELVLIESELSKTPGEPAHYSLVERFELGGG